MRGTTKLAALPLAAALLGAAAAAAGPAGSRETREFVQAAAATDTFETMAAQSALAESRDPQVLEFARMMIRDHNETSRVLREAVTTAGLEPPPIALNNDQSSFLAALQSLRGRAFDQGYWRQQALAHRAALATTQAYAANGDTPAIRRAAAAAVPIIQSHLAMAEQMNAKSGS